MNLRTMTNDNSDPTLIKRHAESLVATALEDTRVVLIAGPRQAGKTTLAKGFSDEGRRYLTLDDDSTLTAARTDPVGFIRPLERAVIDEIQRAPELILAIKESVDRNQTPGRFLLTGSANLSTLPTVADSLAGRMEVISLLPFAQSELRGTKGTFLDRMFAGEEPLFSAPVTHGEALVHAVLQGGYPAAVRRPSEARRRSWLTQYVQQVLDRDVRDIARVEQIEKLPAFMAVLAEHAGQLINQSAIGAALNLSHVTTQRYAGILERLFLIRRLTPWYTNRLSRLIKTPKLHFLDSGLLAALRQIDTSSIAADRTLFGPLLETFVVTEVMKLVSWSEGNYRLSHFRTRDQDEVDIVIENGRGQIVAIEVKASSTIRSKDSSGLQKLQEAAGDKFLRGLILHDHDRVTPIAEKIQAAPVSILWEM
jgi:predicted AAA+ superfamily ATPase